MKKVILTTAAIVLVGGGVTYAAVGNDKTTVEDSTLPENHEKMELDNVSTDHFTETDALSGVVNMDSLNAEVVKDNKHKRVILLKDDNGHPKVKSIFVKYDSRLKVIDFDKGKIVDEVIGGAADAKTDDDVSTEMESNDNAGDTEEADIEKNDTKGVSKEESSPEKEESNTLEGMDEYSVIAEHVDVDKYAAKVVEDNANKRVMLLNDDNRKPEYKTIYIKHKNMLKIIDLNGGLVHKGTI